jgi:hypothetical protein
MKGDEDLKTNNKKFTQKLEDYKYILLDYSLYINELKNNKQKEIDNIILREHVKQFYQMCSGYGNGNNDSR